jgi:bacterioferritin
MHSISETELSVGDQTVAVVDKDGLVELLNGDLAREYQSMITYLQYSASVTGPYRQELKQFFADEIPDETRHAQYLADKIAAFGGVPTVTPAPVPQETDARRMLENIVEAERLARNQYSARAAQAEVLGEIGLSNHLEEFADDESRHLDETWKILQGWR